MKSKEEIEYEERVKRRVLILRDLMKDGRMSFNEDMKDELEKSFLKARFNENGEPDLDTIDPLLRSIALMAEHFDDREKMKDAISLLEIQQRYFEIIEINFGVFYKKMLEYNITPHAFAKLAIKTNSIDFLNEPIEKFVAQIKDFWNLLAEPGYIHLEDDYNSTKAVFGGDLFPMHDENIASKCGIYTDTIILPCPFIRTEHLFKIFNKEDRVYLLLKHALNVLQYKDLALAKVEKPIVVILPDKEMLNEFALEQIKRMAEKDALYHAYKLFQRKFDSVEELLEFASQLDTIEKVMTAIKNPKKVLFDINFKEPLEVQIKEQLEANATLHGTNNPGLAVSNLGFGRMGVCNELLTKAAILKGVPLIDAPTSWEYFKWKLEYDAERANSDNINSKMHIVKGLNGLSDTTLQWIGKIPSEGLIELRKNNAINEIRDILSKGIDELVLANKSDFEQTSEQVFKNLNEAFKRHQNNIQELTKKKWKIAGKDFGSWIVIGSVEIASACIGTPLYGISAIALNQILDAPKLKDLPKTIKEIKKINDQKENQNKSALGLMFKYKDI